MYNSDGNQFAKNVNMGTEYTRIYTPIDWLKPPAFYFAALQTHSFFTDFAPLNDKVQPPNFAVGNVKDKEKERTITNKQHQTNETKRYTYIYVYNIYTKKNTTANVEDWLLTKFGWETIVLSDRKKLVIYTHSLRSLFNQMWCRIE